VSSDPAPVVHKNRTRIGSRKAKSESVGVRGPSLLSRWAGSLDLCFSTIVGNTT
jgi:hypothetical protein